MSELPKEAHDAIERALAEHQATEMRRRQQQGLGRPIVSIEIEDHRIVAVGKTIHSSKQWKTFHDFLLFYVFEVFGREWIRKELSKGFERRHVLVRWAQHFREMQNSTAALTPGAEIKSTVATATMSAYLGLAYNLYLMKHNAKLQTTLIARLKNSDESSFHGAYHETMVAGVFLKAGYEIAFEDEGDGSRSHCEFVAIPPGNGRKFSVEAKARVRREVGPDILATSLKLGVKDKLESALQKKADHTRVVFIEVNLPEDSSTPSWIGRALKEIRDLESTYAASDQEQRPAYVVLTNFPYQFDPARKGSALLDAINMPDFKFGMMTFPNLRSALENRDKHADIHNVFDWVTKIDEIPSTFKGEIPELHFEPDNGLSTLQIGNRYVVPDKNGVEHLAELVHATVIEDQKRAVGVYQLDDGSNILVFHELSDQELNAYRKYSGTFFGRVDKNAKRKCENPVDLYDFFFETYRKSSKEQLLELMRGAMDIETLRPLPQEDLAKIYCERLAYSAVHLHSKPVAKK